MPDKSRDTYLVSINNIAAHEYGRIDEEVLWETAHKSVDLLREFCEKII